MKHWPTVFAASLGVIALSIGGFASQGAAQASTKNAEWEAYTKRQIVRAVAFADGPVAERLHIADEPAGLDYVEKEKLDGLTDRLENRMWQEDAPQLAEAVTFLTSGDPYQVRRGQIEVGKAFARALDAEVPDAGGKLEAQPLCGLVAPCVTFAVLASVAGVALAVVAETVVAGHANVVTATNVAWGRSAPDEDARPLVDETHFTALLTEGLAEQ